MSDPAYDAVFECHGMMTTVDLFELTDCASDRGSTAAYLCTFCGVWRHAYRLADVERRAIVAREMPHFIRDIQR